MSKPKHVPNREANWIECNRDHLWQNYAGKWIAVSGEELITVGDDPEAVLDEAARMGHPNAVVSGVRRRAYQEAKLIRRS